jgi:molybdopterin-dependent oxidoreductase alpha subunit
MINDDNNLEEPYSGTAAGITALTESFHHLKHEKAIIKGTKALLRMNKPGGFDCPGCAWPDPENHSHFEFCENGVKAIAAESTSKIIGADFFNTHTVTNLLSKEAYWLEQQGRLAEPMVYSSTSDTYLPISWPDAFQLIGHTIRSYSPNESVFYTSGRTSNEAAFLYQLLGRELGTNNFPDCSNMCHESSGVAMNEAIGVGKGTVTLADFELAEAIFIFGQNPGTNHPRMLTELEKANKRGAKIVSFNPLKEKGLLDFQHPQHVKDILTNTKNQISTHYYQVLIGGDFALLKGIIKAVLQAAEANPSHLDQEFISTHTEGFEKLKTDIADTSWKDIVEQSGLSQQQIEEAAHIYLHSSKTIICWAMGLTQHTHAVITIQYVINLLMLKGNLGKPGAGACPVRGHSNVQGDRTMGIYEKPDKTFIDSLNHAFEINAPYEHGYDTVAAIKAMNDGKVKVLIGMGGNFASATPDTGFTENAIKKCGLTVHISTKLNRSHLITGKQALILPCLGRTEIDLQQNTPQFVTVEDSMSMVHSSEGKNSPISAHLLSETAIVVGIAKATLKNSQTAWAKLGADYHLIRDKIAQVLPDFKNFNERIKQKGGFKLSNAAAERKWDTANGKATFYTQPLPNMAIQAHQLKLMTIRSHDQYNTTIYGKNDRYRGIYGERKILLMNATDMQKLNILPNERVNIHSYDQNHTKRSAFGFKVKKYDIPITCAAAYFPETNVLVPIDSFAHKSQTPTSKYIVVELEKVGSGN